MSVIDNLEIIDGYFDSERFMMRGIAGYAITGTYKADGLRSMARLIYDGEPFQFTIDKERTIFVPVEKNRKLKQELFMIADELEVNQKVFKLREIPLVQIRKNQLMILLLIRTF